MHPLFAESSNPRLYLKHIHSRKNNSSEWDTKCFFGVATQRFRAAWRPYPTPPPPHHHQLHTCTFQSSCPQPFTSVFIFWIAYHFAPNTGKYMYFVKIPIFPAFFRNGIRNPHRVFWPWLTPQQPLFVFCHYQLQHLLPPIFLPQLPVPPRIPFQDYIKPNKQTTQIQMFNIFERIRRVP